MSAALSGRVLDLENQVSYFTQELLQKINMNTSSEQSSLWNQHYNSLYDTVTQMQLTLRTLQSLYANLSFTVISNYNLYTGHTGLPAVSGHNGL